MPELPEVQTVVNDLKANGLLGHRISEVAVYWPRSVEPLSPDLFRRRLRGSSIDSIRRRGKYIVMALSGGRHLLVHLRMTGRLDMVRADRERDRHEHVVFSLGRARQLRFHDTRKFGRLLLTEDPDTILGGLGPEPLSPSFSAKSLNLMLRGRRRNLKPLLLDQTLIAGIGNIYSDEALWRAGLHPLRQSDSVSFSEAARLHRAIRFVLRKAIRNQGTSLGEGEGNFAVSAGRRGRNRSSLEVFRRTGEPCARCGATIERIIVGRRSTHICPRCQEPGG